MTMALVLLEHLWVQPLLQAVQRADGFELRNEWVEPDALIAVGIESAAARGDDD